MGYIVAGTLVVLIALAFLLIYNLNKNKRDF